jgi:transcriptional regulator with GAF, ATPase, and Fis domain
MLVNPIVPVTKAERLAGLRHYHMLPFLHDDVLDEFVGLAAHIFSLPISLFNLVDTHQVRTEAHYGEPGTPPQPRAETLCSTVVEQNQVVVYHDLLAAIPTPTNAVAIQIALAKRIRFYAAAPVRLTDQHSFGVLCLLGQQPREFTAQEQYALQSLADLVSEAIVVRQHCRTTPALGEAHWRYLHALLHEEVQALARVAHRPRLALGATIGIPRPCLAEAITRFVNSFPAPPPRAAAGYCSARPRTTCAPT